jgi:sugar lactone lactonase YvrE
VKRWRTLHCLWRTTTLLTGVVLAFAIGAAPALAANSSPIVWPAPPGEARIAFVQSFSAPEDLGIKKGFFGRLGAIFTGDAANRLIRPMSVLEHNGVIYVGDPGAKAVHRFDTRRKRHTMVLRAKQQPLPSPVGLARGKHGKIYVTDSILGGVYVLTAKSKVAEPFVLDTPVKQPTGIAVDGKTGNLYITDTASHQIRVFSDTGTLVKTIGQRSDATAGFNYPTMLWKSGQDELLVTDSLNFRIQTFDLDGKYLRSFGKLGNATGYLSRPKGVATDSAGNIYVVDALFHALQIFDPRGELLLYIGKQGHADGEFWLPAGIYIAEDRKIYIADSHNRRVQVFRPTGGKES